MSLKFWLGGASSDKSRQLIRYILDDADKNPTTQYLYVAPEQYGLATQQELVFNSKNKGILNIDVLSFSRLAHRIIDEVGAYEGDVTTLDETGKSLLIGMIASANRKGLSVFADDLEKPGYTDRLKSVISEFMQYGISVDKAFEMADAAQNAGRGMLAGKLSDIALIYKEFKDYTKNRYTTVEETLDVVSALVPRSDTIKNSVIVFDGFTGFTPVQNKLIGVLMEYAREIHVALLYEDDNDCIQDQSSKQPPNDKKTKIKEHELFYLSKHTMDQLGRMADERRISIQDPYKSDKNAINNTCNPKNDIVYSKDDANAKLNNTSVRIYTGQNPDEEIRMTFSRIMELIQTKGYRYRDIAILTGDMDSYAYPIERELSRHGIPFFTDRTEPVMQNPFIEYIRSFLDILCDNYSQTSVFRFLKSGLAGFDDEMICKLENYCLAANIKGYKRWHEDFMMHTNAAGDDELAALNDIRERFAGKCDLFTAALTDGRMTAASRFSIRQFSTALYRLIEADGIEDKLKGASARFEETGNRKMQRIYDKIYAKIMDILDEMCELIPDEITDIRGFANLLDVGLNNIRIGLIPQGADYIQVGDLTRSRIGDIKALFIVGANDGVIPKIGGSGSLINDNDRQFLEEADNRLVLAPTSREDVYTQQLYIYMAVNRPKECLYVSYPRVSSGGKSLLPSYIIKKLMAENPSVTLETMPKLCGCYADETQAFDELTDLLDPVLSGRASAEQADRVKELLKYFLASGNYRKRLLNMIRSKMIIKGTEDDDTIGSVLAHAIYGRKIVSNITKLENYANCAYRYFLEHGLALSEREIFSFEARDVGNIFHDSMKEYSLLMQQNGCSWTGMDPKEQEGLMDAAVDKVMAKYRDEKLSSSARYAYMEHRIRNIMQKSAKIVSSQLEKGKFTPKYFEIDFDKMSAADSISIRLSDDEMMRLRGRIDRVDTYETEDGIYIRIIDYKSRQHSIDLAAVYEGRQLQLLVYLNAATEGIRRKNARDGKDIAVIPAGVLYYTIDDPMIAVSGPIGDDDLNKQVMKSLRLDGLVNSDVSVVKLMDDDPADSTVLPVKLSAKGTFAKSDPVIDKEGFDVLSGYVTKCIEKMGRRILDGNIAIPAPDGKERFTTPNCKYCPFRSICANKGKTFNDNAKDASGGDTADWIGRMKEQTEESDEDNT